MNNMLAVQDNLRIVIIKVVEARQKLVDQKEVLALEREDATALKLIRTPRERISKKPNRIKVIS